ncbi:unnamed protein product [Mesocestoides corti]|uniref:Splicing factor 3B subunit 6 n=1 Tax=Mesocestoides corti TaxID=53468 RepID=A0A0R3U1L2_MESCO|nr:unnamed protein product [Mesocestoides corti]
MALGKRSTIRLPPEVNRVLLVKNLPYNISAEEMYDLFGKYGAIRQIRVGNTPETKGTALVVYEDIFDAKNACDHLSGFNVCNRYLVVLYYQRNKCDDDDDGALDRVAGVLQQHRVAPRPRVVSAFELNTMQFKKADVDKKRETLDHLKAKYGLNTPRPK